MIEKIKSILIAVRDDKLKRSMFLNTLCKPIGMVISFFYTPVLLGYLGEESYGIWSTIFSVINWIAYFDVGIGNGLRNMLARYVGDDKQKDANHAVSTGYIALSVIAGCVLLVGTALISMADVGALFNTNLAIRPVLLVSFSCICVNFVLELSKTQLYATQQAEKVGFMTLAVQLINLLGIRLISTFSSGNLLYVAIIIGLSGIIVNLAFSGGIWRKYQYLRPKASAFQREKLKDICNVGVRFFLIQIAALVLYSTSNMIITQLFGPAAVTPYHTVYTAFGIVNGMFSAMITPLWSKYTVALAQEDYQWIKKTVMSFVKLLPLVAIVLAFGVVAFEPVSRIWLGKNLNYEPGLIPCMGLYYFLLIWGSIYATVLNGMGRTNLQLIMGVGTAILNIPLSIFLGGHCGLGTTGVLLATVICMLITDIPVTIDTHRYINKLIQSQSEKGSL